MFSCTYATAVQNYYLYWYRHIPDSGPEFILSMYSRGGEEKADFSRARFSAQLQTERKFTSLTLSGLLLSDSAVYYCALRSTVMKPDAPSYKNISFCFAFRADICLQRACCLWFPAAMRTHPTSTQFLLSSAPSAASAVVSLSLTCIQNINLSIHNTGSLLLCLQYLNIYADLAP